MSAVFQAMKEKTASSLHLFRRVDCRMDIQLIFFFKSCQFTKSQQKLKTEAFNKRFKELSLWPEFKSLFS